MYLLAVHLRWQFASLLNLPVRCVSDVSWTFKKINFFTTDTLNHIKHNKLMYILTMCVDTIFTPQE